MLPLAPIRSLRLLFNVIKGSCNHLPSFSSSFQTLSMLFTCRTREIKPKDLGKRSFCGVPRRSLYKKEQFGRLKTLSNDLIQPDRRPSSLEVGLVLRTYNDFRAVPAQRVGKVHRHCLSHYTANQIQTHACVTGPCICSWHCVAAYSAD